MPRGNIGSSGNNSAICLGDSRGLVARPAIACSDRGALGG